MQDNRIRIKISAEEITHAGALKIHKGNFILKKKEKFRDNYQIGSQMGVGAFGEVRKCQHKRIKAIRAVKIIKKQNLTPKEMS